MEDGYPEFPPQGNFLIRGKADSKTNLKIIIIYDVSKYYGLFQFFSISRRYIDLICWLHGIPNKNGILFENPQNKFQ